MLCYLTPLDTPMSDVPPVTLLCHETQLQMRRFRMTRAVGGEERRVRGSRLDAPRAGHALRAGGGRSSQLADVCVASLTHTSHNGDTAPLAVAGSGSSRRALSGWALTLFTTLLEIPAAYCFWLRGPGLCSAKRAPSSPSTSGWRSNWG